MTRTPPRPIFVGVGFFCWWLPAVLWLEDVYQGIKRAVRGKETRRGG